MNTCGTNVYEEEIDLIDLFWNLLEKWKLMVVFAVIGAVLQCNSGNEMEHVDKAIVRVPF